MKDSNEHFEEHPPEDSGYYDVFHAPYIAGFSERIAKDLKNLNIGVTFQKGRILFNSLCKLKPPRSQNDRKNVIYCIGCESCDHCYIGETQQLFSSREYQHQYALRCKKKRQWNHRTCKKIKSQNQLEWKSFSRFRSTLEKKKDQRSNFYRLLESKC